MSRKRASLRHAPRVVPTGNGVAAEHRRPGLSLSAASPQNALEEARTLYAELYELGPVGYAALSTTGCVRHINLSGAKLLGVENLVGCPLLPLVAPKHREQFLAYLRLLRKGSKSLATELLFNVPHQEPLLLQLVSETVVTSSEPLVLTVFMNVTEQRRAELELSESRSELAAITASALDAIISLDESQNIVLFNTAAEEMFGCPAGRALGKPLLRFVYGPFHESVNACLRNFTRGNLFIGARGSMVELWGQRMSGEVFQIEASMTKSVVAGRNRITLVMRDITERKLAEQKIQTLNGELEQRVRDRTARLADANRKLEKELAERRQLQKQILQISEREQRRIGQDLHDGIGQQLTGLMFLNDTLVRRLDKVCPAEAGTARRLRELLAQTKVQAHELAHGLQPVPPFAHGLMTALGRLAQSISALHGVDCRFRCPGSVLLNDNLVATHLYRIAQEAIHNAIRHGQSKRIQVALVARNGYIRLVVEDSGRRPSVGGLEVHGGLGLQIMKSRCEAIGAALSIGTMHPQGTRVQCQVPLPQPNGK